MQAPVDWKKAYLLDVASILLLLWASALLAGGGGYHRYSYYIGLRNVVSLAWLLAAVRFSVFRWWAATIIGVAIVWLFNPVSPIYMHKWQWQPYDRGTLVLSLAAAVALGVLSYRAHVGSSKSTQ